MTDVNNIYLGTEVSGFTNIGLGGTDLPNVVRFGPDFSTAPGASFAVYTDTGDVTSFIAAAGQTLVYDVRAYSTTVTVYEGADAVGRVFIDNSGRDIDVNNIYLGSEVSGFSNIGLGATDLPNVIRLGPDFSTAPGSSFAVYTDVGDVTDVLAAPGQTLDIDIGAYSTTVTVFEDDEAVGRIFIDNTSVTCFTRGSRVATPSGPRLIEELQAGDLVLTRDNGPQPLRWIGATKVTAETLVQFPEKRPVTIAAGTFGDHDETTVSPHHRVIVEGWKAEALFGQSEVLATAASLLAATGVSRAAAAEVDYMHLLFDAHEVVQVDGLWSESFHPAALGTDLSSATRDEVIELFPELETGVDTSLARQSLSAADVAVMI